MISTLLILTLTSLIFFPFQFFWFGLVPEMKGYNWFLLVIILVFLTSVNEIFTKWNIKTKRFGRNAKYGIAGQAFSKVYGVIYGLRISNSGIGLISTEVVIAIWRFLFFLSVRQMKIIFGHLLRLKKYSLWRSIVVAKKAINYPKYIWPGNWLNMFSNQLPILFFTGFFSFEEVGAFTFAGSLIAIPSRLIGNAIRPVFFQKSQELYDSGDLKTLSSFAKKISFYLFLVSLPAFLSIIFFGTDIFQFVFGEDWALSGKIASYMAVIQLSAFSVSPISSLFLILRNEKKLLYFQVFLFIARFLLLSISILMNFGFIKIVMFYAITNFIAYIVLHFLVQRLIR